MDLSLLRLSHGTGLQNEYMAKIKCLILKAYRSNQNTVR